MKNFLSVLFIALICASCESGSKPECNNLTLENSAWLRELQSTMNNCLCQLTLYRGEYNGGTVYFIIMNDPVCNSVFATTLYNCEGDVVKEYGDGDLEAFGASVTLGDVIYTCNE